MNKTLFRYIVTTGLILSILSIIFSFLPNDTPNELNNYTGDTNFHYPIWFEFIIGLIAFIALFANISLLSFKLWARPVFTATCIICYFLTINYGPIAYSALENTLISFTTLFDGAIIALLYFSPISKHFNSSDEQPNPSDEDSADSFPIKNKNSNKILKFTIAGVLIGLIAYGSTFFYSGDENSFISKGEIIDAHALLNRFGFEADEIELTVTNALLNDIYDYKINYQQLTENEQVDQWLNLFESSLKVEKNNQDELYEFDYYDTENEVRASMMVMPNPDQWHLLNKDKLPTGKNELQNIATHTLFSHLNADKTAIKNQLERLEQNINNLEGKNKSIRLRSLYKIKTANIMASEEPVKILSLLNKKLDLHRDHIETINVPNLVNIVGHEKTAQWLKHALITDKVVLNIPDYPRASAILNRKRTNPIVTRHPRGFLSGVYFQ